VKIIKKHRKQGQQFGFTLIELAVGIAIMGILGVSIVTSIALLYNTRGSTSDDVMVQNQVANAATWIARDAQMADTQKIDQPAGTLVKLQWIEWIDSNSSIEHTVIYSINVNNELERAETIAGSPVITTIATNIDPALTSCSYDPDMHMIRFQVTASITRDRTESATSIVKVIPRTYL
jgi:prepilin-type N-terminal cleavage/methylation domain-containing protein